ncbi:hypothetical protein GCM10022292_23800 [Winogradskyella damuponensis]|uniref:Uncharacterized protein n=1 Tax=Winogradskyella damuponensis TaxID=943939 RepID=A0ABP8CY51_9FLAO
MIPDGNSKYPNKLIRNNELKTRPIINTTTLIAMILPKTSRLLNLYFKS